MRYVERRDSVIGLYSLPERTVRIDVSAPQSAEGQRMRIVLSIRSVFRRLPSREVIPVEEHPTSRFVCPDAALLIAAHPSGQSYSWGACRSPSNVFAPAIGYDAYPGGYGY